MTIGRSFNCLFLLRTAYRLRDKSASLRLSRGGAAAARRVLCQSRASDAGSAADLLTRACNDNQLVLQPRRAFPQHHEDVCQ